MSLRKKQLQDWLNEVLGNQDYSIDSIVSDASFRKYYRITMCSQSWVVMDAPPEKERPDAFFRVARMMLMYKLNVPECIACHQELGFILLTDFGNTQLYHVKDKTLLYDVAIEVMLSFRRIDPSLVPVYEKVKFLSEMALLQDWFYELIGYNETSVGVKLYERLKEELTNVCLLQPQTFIHRDYHSKNLMVLRNDKLGIIDFQDAVYGPITYDLVSLLRDCYIDLSDDYVYEKVRFVYQEYQSLLKGVSLFDFQKWFDYVALQRHTKCLGIFARLALRDEKHEYLQHIPRLIQYINKTLNKYEGLSYFKEFWFCDVLPVYNKCEVI